MAFLLLLENGSYRWPLDARPALLYLDIDEIVSGGLIESALPLVVSLPLVDVLAVVCGLLLSAHILL